MDQQVINAMFALLRKAVCGTELAEETKNTITVESLPQLYALSQTHDLAHIIAQELFNLGVLGDDEISQKFLNQQMLAVYRYQRLNYEFGRICQVFEEEKIPFIPLKGSVIRQYYPEPWMRTSCDIDILVHEENLDQAIKQLKEKLCYTIKYNRNYHDISMFSESGIHLELHFNIQEDIESLDRVLSCVWDYAVPHEGMAQRSQTSEYFLFHQIAHAAYHFVNGGCGVRPFLDLWIFRKHMAYDEQKVVDFCAQCGIDKFYFEMKNLSDVWFSERAHDLLTEQMGDYILKSGVYGNIENRIAMKQNQTGGRLKYVLSRIWRPYNSLKIYYPILNTHKWLFPFMQVLRWTRLFRKKKVRHSLQELTVNQSISKEKVSETTELLTQLGLK